jgi:geranylgeranylglycerol-phosphate geranylgeranyltransferase
LLFDLRRQRKRDKQAAGRRILLRRINLVRILSLLSLIVCFVLLTLLPRYEPGSSEYYKTELAFNAYALCIFLCLVVEILDFLKMMPGMTVLSRFLMGFVYLSRCVTSCLIGLCVFLPSLYSGLGVKASFLHALPFVFAAIGGFGLNDYFDADKDAINKPYRAIPSKKLTKKTVLLVGLANLTFASLCAAYVADTWLQAVLYGITILGVSCYNIFVRYLSLSKTVLTSIVSGLPILFSVTTIGYSRSYLFLPVGAAFFVLGREWLMDIGDMEGDLKGQIVTVPMLIGTERTALFGFLFQFLSVLFMLPIALSVNSVALYALLFSILLAVICLRSLWQSGRKEYQRRVVQLLWVPMLLGVLMLVW